MFLLRHELEGLVIVPIQSPFPRVDIKIDVAPPSLRGGVAREPQPQVLVVPPLAIKQLFRRIHLQRVLGHVIEDIEQRLQLELGQVTRLQGRGLHVITIREDEVRLAATRVLHARVSEGGVQHLGGVEVEAEGGQVRAEGQRVEVWMCHANH